MVDERTESGPGMSRADPLHLRAAMIGAAVVALVWIPIRLWLHHGDPIADVITIGGVQALAGGGLTSLIGRVIAWRRGTQRPGPAHAHRAAVVALAVGAPLCVAFIASSLFAGLYVLAFCFALLLLLLYVTADENPPA